MTEVEDIEARCAICGWPLVERVEEGCVRGNCSQRPWPPRFYDPERADREYGHAVSETQQPLPAIMLENQRLVARIAVLKGRVQKAGWEYAHGSLDVVYVNDVIDWLDELCDPPVSSPPADPPAPKE